MGKLGSFLGVLAGFRLLILAFNAAEVGVEDLELVELVAEHETLVLGLVLGYFGVFFFSSQLSFYSLSRDEKLQIFIFLLDQRR